MIAIGFDSAENIGDLESYRQNIGASNWMMATTGSEMFRELGVFSRSTKIMFNDSGGEIFRRGYGNIGEEGWRTVLELLPDPA